MPDPSHRSLRVARSMDSYFPWNLFVLRREGPSRCRTVGPRNARTEFKIATAVELGYQTFYWSRLTALSTDGANDSLLADIITWPSEERSLERSHRWLGTLSELDEMLPLAT